MIPSPSHPASWQRWTRPERLGGSGVTPYSRPSRTAAAVGCGAGRDRPQSGGRGGQARRGALRRHRRPGEQRRLRLPRRRPAPCARNSPRSASASPSSNPARSVPSSPVAPSSSPPPSSTTTPRRPASAARRTTPPAAPSAATLPSPREPSSPRWPPTSRRGLLMLGPDALRAIRAVFDNQLAELRTWEETSLSTDLQNWATRVSRLASTSRSACPRPRAAGSRRRRRRAPCRKRCRIG
jgi:hypothetical protein